MDCAAGKSSKFEAGYLRYWPPLDAVPSAGGLHEGSCGSSCQIAGGANFPLIYNFQDGRRQEIYEINFYAGWSGTSSPSDLFNLSSPPLLGQILVSGTTSSDPTFDGYSRPHAIFKLPEAIQPKKLTLALCGSNIVSGDEMERTCTPDWQASQLEWKWYGSETGQDGSWAMLLSNVQVVVQELMPTTSLILKIFINTSHCLLQIFGITDRCPLLSMPYKSRAFSKTELQYARIALPGPISRNLAKVIVSRVLLVYTATRRGRLFAKNAHPTTSHTVSGATNWAPKSVENARRKQSHTTLCKRSNACVGLVCF